MELVIGSPLTELAHDLRGLSRTPESRLRWMAGARRLPGAALVVSILCLLQLATGLIEAVPPVVLPSTAGMLPPDVGLLVDQATQSVLMMWNRYRFLFPVAAVLSTPPLWVLGATLVHLTARLLGGHGRYRQYVVLTGYLQGLALLAIPFSLAAGMLTLLGRAEAGQAFHTLAILLLLAILTVRVLLEIMAARVVYQLSGARATIAVLTPYTIPLVVALGFLVWGTVLLISGNLIR
jgi:hypothetical protein